MVSNDSNGYWSHVTIQNSLMMKNQKIWKQINNNWRSEDHGPMWIPYGPMFFRFLKLFLCLKKHVVQRCSKCTPQRPPERPPMCRALQPSVIYSSCSIMFHTFLVEGLRFWGNVSKTIGSTFPQLTNFMGHINGTSALSPNHHQFHGWDFNHPQSW